MRANYLVSVLLALLITAFHTHAQEQQSTPPATTERAFMLTLSGVFGRDVEISPVNDALAAARAKQPTVLVVKLDCDYFPDRSADAATDTANQFELASLIAPALTEQLRDDPAWTTKPRLVFWVARARGGAGLLPFISFDVYYTTTAIHDTCPLDALPRVSRRSNPRSLLESLTRKASQPVELFTAMSQTDYILSADLAPGRKPSFRQDATGEVLLTDATETLSLDATTAFRYGLSRGTVDSLHELWSALGFNPADVQIVGDSNTIFDRWRHGVVKAEKRVPQLMREFNAVTVDSPGGYDERRRARAKRMKILTEVRELLQTYSESMSSDAIDAVPADLLEKINASITNIQQQQTLDRRG